MTGPSRLVVVGASLAGLRAVEAARKAGHAGPITLVGAEEHLPYDRPPLSKELLDARPSAVAPTFRDESHLVDDLGVDLRLGTCATGLDTSGRVVATTAGDVAYDALVVTTGARARTLPDTAHLDGVHALRTLDDALAVRGALDAGARTVVIGAGFIGSEVASGARKRGLDVTVVEAQPAPLQRAIGAVAGPAVAGLHERHGTRLLCGTAVAGLTDAAGRVTGVRLADGTLLPADLVVVGIGATPETGWLADSGLHLDDGIVCDARLATSAVGVHAAGDVASWHNPVLERRHRLEHWSSAAEQGAAAARNALDPDGGRDYGTVPYFWSDWYDVRIQFVGTPDADEVVVVDGDQDTDRWTALYRRGDRLVGALTLQGQSVIMKYRAQVLRRTSWDEALAFAAGRRAAREPAASR